MFSNNKRAAIAAAWFSATVIVAFAADIHSTLPWLVVTVVAMGPPLVLLHLSRELKASTSQSIQHAKR